MSGVGLQATPGPNARAGLPAGLPPGEPVGERALDQRAVPLLSAVRAEVAAISTRAHAPGHVGARAASLDVRRLLGAAVLEADVWLETSHLQKVRRQAEDLAAAAWGARRAWMLGGGSSSGNIAWCLATLSEGQDVVVARDVHTSVLTGLVLSGARPRWVTPWVHPRQGVPLGVEPGALQETLTRYPGTRAVILSSPGYSGTCTDVRACVRVAEAHGATVYVDQAWGAHFAFHPALPDDAIAAGAAGAVVSLHKSGAALSSGALLLAGAGADTDRLQAAVTATWTTSPLLPLLVSVDAARRDFAVGGAQRAAGVMAAARWLAGELEQIPGLHVPTPHEMGLSARRWDPCKVIVDVSGLRYTGWEVERLLRDGGTAVEGADARRLCVLLGSDPAAAEVIAAGVLADLGEVARMLAPAAAPSSGTGGRLASWLDQDLGEKAGAWDLLEQDLPVAVMTPRQAFQAPSRMVAAREAVGQVAAEAAVPYPPGVPVLMPGEVVTGEVVDVLHRVARGGGHLYGCADPAGARLRVIAPP